MVHMRKSEIHIGGYTFEAEYRKTETIKENRPMVHKFQL